MNSQSSASHDTANHYWRNSAYEIIKSLGLVFGDVGTSPIYTLPIIFLTIPVTPSNVLGVLSLVIWTLSLLVFGEYVILAMSLGKKGEGGTIVLRELLTPLLRNKRNVSIVTFFSIIGISLMFGDSVITPAISIISAVEGIQLIPSIDYLPAWIIVTISSIIAFLLFYVQKRGTDKISTLFGPIMLIWFMVLSVSGINSLLSNPALLAALNPLHALRFILEHKWNAFFILSSVTLCATGGEGLYADMGHLGRKPIQRASIFVFFALIATYIGQGAFLLQYPNTRSILYEMILYQADELYIPFLLLSLCATVIASQAMISGIFSVVYQGIVTNLLPPFKIDYTSDKMQSQIYIGLVNYCLCITVIFLIIKFQSTKNLSALYGLAVTGTMTITGLMMGTIFYRKKYLFKAFCSWMLAGLAFIFFLSNTFKIPHGGYWSLLIACVPFSIISIYTRGQKKLDNLLIPTSLDEFVKKYHQCYDKTKKLPGSALFFTKYTNAIAPYIQQVIFNNGIVYDDIIIVSIITRDVPFGVICFFKENLASGIRIFEIHMGYMEIIDIESHLVNAGINPKVIFYGIENVVTKNPIWKIYSLIKRITPSRVTFYKLPAYKLHGVITVVEM